MPKAINEVESISGGSTQRLYCRICTKLSTRANVEATPRVSGFCAPRKKSNTYVANRAGGNISGRPSRPALLPLVLEPGRRHAPHAKTREEPGRRRPEPALVSWLTSEVAGKPCSQHLEKASGDHRDKS